MSFGRKSLLALAALLALLPFQAGVEAAAQPEDLPFTLKEVGPGVYAAIDNADHSDISKTTYANAGFVVGDDSVLVIDSFIDRPQARALLEEIRKVTTKPVRYLVNTHFHLDHVMGNVVFHDAGARLVVHRNARTWIKDENMARSKPTAEALAIYATFPSPDILIDKLTTLRLGSRRVVIRPALGHTGGDLTVSVPDAKVVFAGDLLWRRRVPTVADGTSRTLLADLATLERLPGATTFVPGHGGVMTAGEVADFRTHIAEVAALTADARRNGLRGENLTAAVTAKLRPRYGDWQDFDRAEAAEVHAMDEELAGIKVVPKPR